MATLTEAPLQERAESRPATPSREVAGPAQLLDPRAGAGTREGVEALSETAGNARAVAAVGGQVEALWQREVAWWQERSRQARDPLQGAKELRVVVQLVAAGSSRFDGAPALHAFVEAADRTAASELDTIARVPAPLLRSYPRAFPWYWSHQVFDALYVYTDIGALASRRDADAKAMDKAVAALPAYLLENGLPVSFQESLTLREFTLDRRHIPLAHGDVKAYIEAVQRWMGSAWVHSLYWSWNRMVRQITDAIEQGKQVVDLAAFDAFIKGKQAGLRTMGDRAQRGWDPETLSALEKEALDLRDAEVVAGFATFWIGIAALAASWEHGRRLFDTRCAEADEVIAAENFADTFVRVLEWAEGQDFFSEAGRQLWDSIDGKAAARDLAIFLVIQKIPVLNVLVDAVVIVYFGVDVLQAAGHLAAAVGRAAQANSTVAGQREAAALSQALVADTVRIALGLLAVRGAQAGIAREITRLKTANPRLTDVEAMRRAIKDKPLLEKALEITDFLERRGNTRLAQRAIEIARGSAADAEIVLKVLEGTWQLTEAELARLGALAPDLAALTRAMEAAHSVGIPPQLIVEALLARGVTTPFRVQMAELLRRIMSETRVTEVEVRRILQLGDTPDLARLLTEMQAKGATGEVLRVAMEAVTARGVKPGTVADLVAAGAPPERAALTAALYGEGRTVLATKMLQAGASADEALAAVEGRGVGPMRPRETVHPPEFYEQVGQRFQPKPGLRQHVHGWTDKPHELAQALDLVARKPGEFHFGPPGMKAVEGDLVLAGSGERIPVSMKNWISETNIRVGANKNASLVTATVGNGKALLFAYTSVPKQTLLKNLLAAYTEDPTVTMNFTVVFKEVVFVCPDGVLTLRGGKWF